MKKGKREFNLLLLVLVFLFCSGFDEATALSYDYSASIECLENPKKPQYGGGIIINPELNNGLEGWSASGNSKIEHRESGGNKFLVLRHSSNQPYDISQKLYLHKNKLYTFSAWIQVSEGAAPVTAVLNTSTGLKYAGAIVAESGCWSMVKGGLTVDESGQAEFYFESKNSSSFEIWVDSISIQPFTREEWRSHQHQIIEKVRKTTVRIRVVDKLGNPLPNATISLNQRRLNFPFGCAINKNILTNTAYQNWFTSRFKVTTFEDEMKWYSTEASQGKVDYSVSDAMLQFAKQHNILVRGHNIIWDDPHWQQGWIYSLSPRDLQKVAFKRIISIVSRYRGQVIAWDVVNENLHFSFFESKLGQIASSIFYRLAHIFDKETRMFMNEFNTIEDGRDAKSSPGMYLAKLRQIKQYPGNENLQMGIGLEGHFGTPNLPYMRASLDTLATMNISIWLTEVDVQNSQNQAEYLEQILREAYSHPKVEGIVMWAAWKPTGCYRMCLTDNNFNNLPTGDVVDKLLHEWGFKPLSGKTDADGFFHASLFHGDYEAKIIHPTATYFSFSRSFKVDSSTDASQQSLVVQVSA